MIDGFKRLKEDEMKVDMREHENIREQVRAGIAALRVQGRQIWGGKKSDPRVRRAIGEALMPIVNRLMADDVDMDARRELKKELGNIIFSTIRWIDDLGLDVMECLDLAIEAQEKFANSGRPR